MTADKTDINEMKQYLMNKPDNMTDSYTDDVKENHDDIEDEIELLPVGLLPQYQQKTFTTNQAIIEKTSPIHGWSLCEHFPATLGVHLCPQAPHQLMINRMPRSIGDDATLYWAAQEVKIADDIEYFVTRGFVVEAEGVVNRTIVTDHEDILR